MVLLREDGRTQPQIGELTGVSLSTVNRAHMADDNGGGQRAETKVERRSNTRKYDLEEEKDLLKQFAKAAGAGELLNIHDLKAAYEKAIEHSTSNSTIYNLLTRDNWRKLMPRPFHPDRDLEAQKDFKKVRSAVPKARLLASAQGLPLRIMFADEARFGRMNRPRRVGLPRG
jgi:hypothetical protein